MQRRGSCASSHQILASSLLSVCLVRAFYCVCVCVCVCLHVNFPLPFSKDAHAFFFLPLQNVFFLKEFSLSFASRSLCCRSAQTTSHTATVSKRPFGTCSETWWTMPTRTCWKCLRLAKKKKMACVVCCVLCLCELQCEMKMKKKKYVCVIVQIILFTNTLHTDCPQARHQLLAAGTSRVRIQRNERAFQR